MNPYHQIIANTVHVKMQLSASNYSISAEVYRTHFSRLPCFVLHFTYECTLRWPAIRSIRATTICPSSFALFMQNQHAHWRACTNIVIMYRPGEVSGDSLTSRSLLISPLSSKEWSTDEEPPLYGLNKHKYTLERAALRSSSKSIN